MAVHLIIGKMKDPTWTSYVLEDTMTGKVLGGCVLREHNHQDSQCSIAELFLLSIKSDCQQKGLGRRMIQHLKNNYSSIVAFADLNALEFFKKQSFLEVGESTRQYKDLLRVIERCDESLLMAF